MYRRPTDRQGREDVRYPLNWSKLRWFVFKRDGYKCQICGRGANLVCHHIHPIGLGGSSHPNNLQTLCKDCHDRIHKKGRYR